MYLKKSCLFISFLWMGYFGGADALTVTTTDWQNNPVTLFQGAPQSFFVASAQLFKNCGINDARNMKILFKLDGYDRPDMPLPLQLTTDSRGGIDGNKAALNFTLSHDPRGSEMLKDQRSVSYGGRCPNLYVHMVPQPPLSEIIKIKFKNNGLFRAFLYTEQPENKEIKPGYHYDPKAKDDFQGYPTGTNFCIAVDKTFGNYQNFYFISTRKQPWQTKLKSVIEPYGRLWDISFVIKGVDSNDNLSEDTNPFGIVPMGDPKGYHNHGACP
jgi:hypothetical protein